MKSISDVRKGRAQQSKYVVVIRQGPIEEEKVALILEKRGITLTQYVNDLIRDAIKEG